MVCDHWEDCWTTRQPKTHLPVRSPATHFTWKGSNYPQLGDLLTMVTNYLLTGMILQVGAPVRGFVHGDFLLSTMVNHH